MKGFLGCSHNRKMTTTRSKVGIIKDLFNLFMCKSSSENGIDTMSIQCIIQDKVVLCVVTDTETIVTGYIGLKSLSLEVND